MEIGKTNSLRVIRVEQSGTWLGSIDGEEVLLPVASNDDDPEINTTLRVFIYTTPEGGILASLTIPVVQVGETALLDIVDRSEAGLWLDWGMPQDLLLPRSELSQPIQASKAFVHVFQDDSGKICASTRFHHFYTEHSRHFRPWDSVQLTIAAQSRLGFKAIINNNYLGLLYSNEVFQALKPGDQTDGFIKDIRDDGRIDLTLYPERVTLKDELGKRILAELANNGGVSRLTDKSPPEEIYSQYQVSKKNYKRALSSLYKARLIQLDDNLVKLVND